MRRPLTLLGALVAGVLGAGVATAATGYLLEQPTVDRMQVVLAPHPDDELFALAALDDAPGTYTVVVSLTRGEQTARCDDPGRLLDDETLRPPEPLPKGRGTPSCAAARADSWRAFLDAAAAVNPELRLGPGAETEEFALDNARLGGAVEVTRGRDSGRVLASLPDGGLVDADLAAATDALLDLRGGPLPDLPLARVVVAGYWNDAPDASVNQTPDGCSAERPCPGDARVFEYEHPDHRAITLAVPQVAAAADAPAWVSVAPGTEPALSRLWELPVSTTHQRALPEDQHRAYVAEDAADSPLDEPGLARTTYGWLSAPGEWWPTVDDADAVVLFPRTQSYAVVEPP